MIDVRTYMHPSETALRDKIFHFTDVNKILDVIMDENLDVLNHFIYSASSLQLPQEHKAIQYLVEGCKLFGVSTVPPVYLNRSYYADINCSGYNTPVIVVPSVLIDKAPDALLRGRMMAAAASVKAEHHRLTFLLWFIDNFKGLIKIPGATTALDAMLYEWLRTQEYTLDRAFYLATRDSELALKNILYGEIPDALLNNFQFGFTGTYDKQVEDFQRTNGAIGVAAKVIGYLQKETWLPERYSELKKFMSGNRMNQEGWR